MGDIAIRADKLCKRYVRQEPQNKMLEWIGLSPKPMRGCSTEPIATGERPSAEFWALKDVSFEIKRGEVIGLIGSNGAGKSTLLKLLSRITEPTSGRADIYGRVGSLLEVGTGFHHDLTGRENVFLNGAFLGMSHRDIRRCFDEIVAFAEIDGFIDTPVKRYSSGMYMRLAFSVAAHLESEILIVDEVLAVGDAGFQQKSLKKMQSLVNDDGRTVLLVTHDAAAIGTLCDSGIYLDGGRTACVGPISDVLRTFGQDHNTRRPESLLKWEGCVGDEDVELLRTWIGPEREPGELYASRDIIVGIEINIRQPIKDLILGFWLVSEFGHDLAFSLYDEGDTSPAPTVSPGRLRQEFLIPAGLLGDGHYRIEFAVGRHMQKAIINRNAGSLAFATICPPAETPRFTMPKRQGLTSVLRPRWRIC